MTVNSVVEILKNILDVLLVWGLLYFILKNLRKNIKMVLLFKIIILIVIVKIISHYLDLTTINFLIDYVIEWAPLALIIIFQPEIRKALEDIGRNKLLGSHKTLSSSEKERTVHEIISAIENLKKLKMGALITIERDSSLANYINKAQKIYAKVTSGLLTSIFYSGSPLHDGAVIIEGDQIACSNAVFPTSDSLNISKRLGTRHRAALEISDQTDALAIVLSEETGRISLAASGQLLYNLSIDELRLHLLEGLSSKKQSLISEEVNTDEKN
ncbi:MAG: diadenylate cyclase CdaA [Bacilli bacterium]|nr:diadenylate cyclase CdaA [Bacilli bacterium]